MKAPRLWQVYVLMVANLAIVAIVGCAVAIASCTPKEAANVAIDLSESVCEELASQPEPEWVRFACVVLDAGGKIVQTFDAKVRKEDASVFAARHCSRDGAPAP